jgi:hypothetical protein
MHSSKALLDEQLFPLAQVPNLGIIPNRRRGRQIHVATLHRWAVHGLNGVVLETLQVGGTRCTSREALRRFFQSLTQGLQAAGGR